MALVTVFQFMEGLTDHQVADAVGEVQSAFHSDLRGAPFLSLTGYHTSSYHTMRTIMKTLWHTLKLSPDTFNLWISSLIGRLRTFLLCTVLVVSNLLSKQRLASIILLKEEHPKVREGIRGLSLNNFYLIS